MRMRQWTVFNLPKDTQGPLSQGPKDKAVEVVQGRVFSKRAVQDAADRAIQVQA